MKMKMNTKEERFNQSVRQLISELVVSCRHNHWRNRYHASSYGQKQLGAYDAAIKKADDILNRGVDNITEDEVYWALSNINGSVIYNGQRMNRHLFAKQLHHKLNKMRPDSFNNNRLVRMLKNSKWLWMYVIEQGE